MAKRFDIDMIYLAMKKVCMLLKLFLIKTKNTSKITQKVALILNKLSFQKLVIS